MIPATLARAAHLDAGNPPPPIDGPACRVCGHPGAEIPWTAGGIPPTYTGDADLRSSSALVCRACSWAMAGRPPKSARLWSAVYRADGDWSSPDATPDGTAVLGLSGARVRLQRPGTMAEVLRVLLAPPAAPWALAVTRTGKVHTWIWAPTCAGGSDARAWFERAQLAWDPAAAREAHGVVVRLREVKATRQELIDGPLSVSTVVRVGVAEARECEAVLSRLRRSPLLELVVRCV